MDDEEFALELDDCDTVMQKPLRAYFASPMTQAPDAARTQNEDVRQVMREEFAICRDAFIGMYDPFDFTAPGSVHTPTEVYRMDLRETVLADMIVLHANSASTGLGIEAQLAANAGVPRLVLSPVGVEVSRMLKGMPGLQLEHIIYRSISELRSSIRIALPSICSSLKDDLSTRQQCREDLLAMKMGEHILRHRIRGGIEQADFAGLAMLDTALVDWLERHDECLLALGGMQISQLANVLNATYRPSRSPPLQPNHKELGEEDAVEQSSLGNLVRYVRARRITNESKIFRLWRHYKEQRSDAVVGRDPLDDVVSFDDWADLYSRDNSLFE